MKSMNRLTRWLAVGVLALVATTWKLWTPQDVFPQIPLLRAACDWPGWFDWVCLAVLVASSLTMLCVARRGWVGRSCCAALAASLLGFFVLDQHRLQPWAWQFFLLAVLLSLADDTTARRGWRWLVIGIYFWSAVSKLDYTFFHEQGPALLGGLKQAMGLRGMPNTWTEALDVCGSVGIALGEMGVAVLLAWPRARWLSLWATTILHVTLLAALGPLGLNHSLGVLLWNVFFLVQNWLLFRTTDEERRQADESLIAQDQPPVGWALLPVVSFVQSAFKRRPDGQECPSYGGVLRNRLALGTILVAMTWPVLEPLGYCDHWLAWAVYSAREESVSVDSYGTPMTKLPIWEISHFGTLKLATWSLVVLGVPVYPQNRFQIGVTSALLRADQINDATVFVYSAGHRVTGARCGRLLDSSSLEAELNRYLVNAHPRRTTFGARSRDESP